MKLFYRICLFVLLPIVIVLGLILMLTGVDVRGMTFAIGVPAILVVCFIGWFMSPTKPKDGAVKTQEQNAQETERNEVALDAQTDALGKPTEPSENKVEQAKQYPLTYAKEASAKGMIIGIAVFVLLLADVIAATVLLINKIYAGAIACAAIFGVVLIALITAIIIRETIANSKNVRYAKKIVGGQVKSCDLTEMKKSGTTDALNASNVAYEVVVSAEDGAEYSAVADRSYEIDEKVYIAVMNKKRGILVEESEIGNIKLDGREQEWSGARSAGRPHNYARRHRH